MVRRSRSGWAAAASHDMPVEPRGAGSHGDDRGHVRADLVKPRLLLARFQSVTTTGWIRVQPSHQTETSLTRQSSHVENAGFSEGSATGRSEGFAGDIGHRPFGRLTV